MALKLNESSGISRFDSQREAGAPASLALAHDDIVETPSWFGPSTRPLFGWFVYPKNLHVRGAVVLCQPIAEESNMAYRTFRTLSQRLARAGFLALRFDYDGTGDSAGSFEDTDRPTAWTGSIRHAVAETRLWGAQNVSLVGMRLGATLGYLAAASSPLDLDDLILWDPCPTGTSFLRELRMLQTAWVGDRVREPHGFIETPSYRFAPEFGVDAARIAIDGRVAASKLARRTTVLARSDRTPHRALLAALPNDETQWGSVSGQAQLLNVPTLHAAVPFDGVADVVSRLLNGAADSFTPLTPRPEPTASWHEGGQLITESACFFGSDPRLFGIRTSSQNHEPSLPQLLFLNVAAERHLGEGRIWLRLSRESARKGFDSVRLDHSGVGDSDTRPGRVNDTVFDENWIDDVPRVAHALSGDSVPNVIGVGMCSSGISALQAAKAGCFREMIAVNVPVDVDLNAALPPAWTVFSRKPRWLLRVAVKHKRVAQLLWDASSVVRPQHNAMWALRSAVMAGVQITLISGPDDIGAMRQNGAWLRLWGRALRTSGRFRVHAAPHADHSLRESRGQDEVMSRLLDRLQTYVPNPHTPKELGIGSANADE